MGSRPPAPTSSGSHGEETLRPLGFGSVIWGEQQQRPARTTITTITDTTLAAAGVALTLTKTLLETLVQAAGYRLMSSSTIRIDGGDSNDCRVWLYRDEASGFLEMCGRLEALGVEHETVESPQFDLMQIYVVDPNQIRVEINTCGEAGAD